MILVDRRSSVNSWWKLHLVPEKPPDRVLSFYGCFQTGPITTEIHGDILFSGVLVIPPFTHWRYHDAAIHRSLSFGSLEQQIPSPRYNETKYPGEINSGTNLHQRCKYWMCHFWHDTASLVRIRCPKCQFKLKKKQKIDWADGILRDRIGCDTSAIPLVIQRGDLAD